MGGLTGLINNAAITNSGGRNMDELTLDMWDRVMDVNVRGTWLVTQAAKPHLAASGRGRVVNLASDTALWGAPRLLAYAASKGAVIAMTRSLAREMGGDPTAEPPFFFTKPADALVQHGAVIAYPPATADLHHEAELVIAINTGGAAIAEASALDHVFGYAAGNDLTRRDLQADAAGRAGDQCDPAFVLLRVVHLALVRLNVQNVNQWP